MPLREDAQMPEWLKNLRWRLFAAPFYERAAYQLVQVVEEVRAWGKDGAWPVDNLQKLAQVSLRDIEKAAHDQMIAWPPTKFRPVSDSFLAGVVVGATLAVIIGLIG